MLVKVLPQSAKGEREPENKARLWQNLIFWLSGFNPLWRRQQQLNKLPVKGTVVWSPQNVVV